MECTIEEQEKGFIARIKADMDKLSDEALFAIATLSLTALSLRNTNAKRDKQQTRLGDKE